MPDEPDIMRRPTPTDAERTDFSETIAWLHLDIVIEDDEWPDPAASAAMIERAAAALAKEVSSPHGGVMEACLALSCDQDVRRLNAEFRGQDKPTNVLSFPARDVLQNGPQSRPFLGDVILARETVLREALEQRLPFEHHLTHLAVHGLLHLLGHDHADDEEAAVMERLETKILASLGIPDPYAQPVQRDSAPSSSNGRPSTT